MANVNDWFYFPKGELLTIIENALRDHLDSYVSDDDWIRMKNKITAAIMNNNNALGELTMSINKKILFPLSGSMFFGTGLSEEQHRSSWPRWCDHYDGDDCIGLGMNKVGELLEEILNDNFV